MASAAVLLADAVRDELNTAPEGTFSKSFSATREYVVEYRVDGLNEIRVPVVPREVEVELESRAADRHEYQVDVGVLSRADLNDPDGIDGLMDLVQEIADHLRRTVFSLTGNVTAVWSGIANDPLFSPRHLREEGVFLSVLTLTYRVTR